MIPPRPSRRVFGCSSLLLLPALALVVLCAAGCRDKGEVGAKKIAGDTPTTPSVRPKRAKPDFATAVASSQPLAPTPTEQIVAGTTITAELCPFSEPLLYDGLMEVVRSIAVSGTDLYLADAQEQLRVYSLPTSGPCKLAPKTAIGTRGVLALDPKVKMVSADASGRVFASSGMFGGTMLKDGKTLYKCLADLQGYVQLHRSGKYGVGSFANMDVAKVDFTDTGCTSAPWAFTNMRAATRQGPFKSVQSIGFADDLVLVGGEIPKEVDKGEPRVVAVMAANGQEKTRFGSTKESSPEDRHGLIHASTGCKPGFCVLDPNLKRITLWKKDGAYVGKVDLRKLTGIFDVWGAALAVDATGSTYLAVGGARESVGQVYEGLIFRLNGL